MSHVLDRLAKVVGADWTEDRSFGDIPAAPPIRVKCSILECEGIEVKHDGDDSNGKAKEGEAVAAEEQNLVPRLGERAERVFLTQAEQRNARRKIEREITMRHIAFAGGKDKVQTSSNSGNTTDTSVSQSSGGQEQEPNSFDLFLKPLSKLKNYPIYVENCSYCMDDSNYSKEDYGLYEMGVHPRLGHYALALKAIREGRNIFHEFPTLTLPSTTNKPETTLCVNCYKKVDLTPGISVRVCEGCYWPVCLFGKCDIAVSLHSKLECEYFRAKGVRFTNDGTFDFDAFWFSIWDKLKICDPIKMDKALELSSGSPTQKSFERLHQIGIMKARSANLTPTAFPDELLEKIIDVCRLNALTYRTDFPRELKYADTLYEVTSKVNHSCLPNMFYVNSPNFHISWIAARNIAAGEQLTICYNEELFFEPTLVRVAYLQNRFKFFCECRRCADPTELNTYYDSLPCFNCFDKDSVDGGYLIYQEPSYYAEGKCDKCGTVCDRSRIAYSLHVLEERYKDFHKPGKTAQDLRLCILSMLADGSVHKYHRFVFKVSLNMFAALRKDLHNNWRLSSIEYLIPYLPFANIVHHIFTTFIPVRQEYRGQILTAVAIVRFAGMINSLEIDEISVQEVEDELKLCFFREMDENGGLTFTPMLELDEGKRKGTIENSLHKALYFMVAKLIYSVKKQIGKEGKDPADFIYIRSTEKGFCYHAEKFKLFPKKVPQAKSESSDDI